MAVLELQVYASVPCSHNARDPIQNLMLVKQALCKLVYIPNPRQVLLKRESQFVNVYTLRVFTLCYIFNTNISWCQCLNFSFRKLDN